jgi:hypothetical protein
VRQIYITTLIVIFFLGFSQFVVAQSKIKVAEQFIYTPEKGKEQYNQLVEQKTLTLSQNAFVILNRQAGNSYTVEKYDVDLKRNWQASIPLSTNETIESFFRTDNAAIVITRKTNEDTQRLYGHRIDLKNGKKQDAILLLEAPLKDRRLSVVASANGSQILTYKYHTDINQQIQDISSILYDANFNKIKDYRYNLNDVTGILSADVKVSDSGEQYIAIISDNMNRLTVRQYSLQSNEAKVMSVLVGGVYEGERVYILDSKFELMPNNTLYGAVLTAEESTGKYYSLKAVKFDFEANDMIFAEEFKFTQAYVTKITTLDKLNPSNRLEDIYLSDILLSANNHLTIIAEKKYTEGGENTPYYAKEMHLFTYDEFMNTAWNSVLLKHQQAAPEEAFSAISYRAYLNGNTLHLLTLEELQDKYDLYLRQIETSTGQTTAPKAIGLNLTDDKGVAYIKDFTTWLSDKKIITIARPNKKSADLRLTLIQLK